MWLCHELLTHFLSLHSFLTHNFFSLLITFFAHAAWFSFSCSFFLFLAGFFVHLPQMWCDHRTQSSCSSVYITTCLFIVTDDIQRVKRLGTIWLAHDGHSANELNILHLYIWLVVFTWDPAACFQSISEALHLPQLHLYRSATGYFTCYLCSSSMS